jgi:hypothetical protein
MSPHTHLHRPSMPFYATSFSPLVATFFTIQDTRDAHKRCPAFHQVPVGEDRLFSSERTITTMITNSGSCLKTIRVLATVVSSGLVTRWWVVRWWRNGGDYVHAVPLTLPQLSHRHLVHADWLSDLFRVISFGRGSSTWTACPLIHGTHVSGHVILQGLDSFLLVRLPETADVYLRVQGLSTHQNPASVLLGICGMTISFFQPYNSKMLVIVLFKDSPSIFQTFNKK